MNVLLRPLNTPIKRVGALVLLVGLAWLVGGLFWVAQDICPSRWSCSSPASEVFDAWWASLYPQGTYSRRFGFLATATWTTLIGLALSYAYDFGAGRVLRWIRAG